MKRGGERFPSWLGEWVRLGVPRLSHPHLHHSSLRFRKLPFWILLLVFCLRIWYVLVLSPSQDSPLDLDFFLGILHHWYTGQEDIRERQPRGFYRRIGHVASTRSEALCSVILCFGFSCIFWKNTPDAHISCRPNNRRAKSTPRTSQVKIRWRTTFVN